MKFWILFVVVVVISFSSLAGELSSRARLNPPGPISCRLLIATARIAVDAAQIPITIAKPIEKPAPAEPVVVRPMLIAKEFTLFDMEEVKKRLDTEKSMIELEGPIKGALQKLASGTSQRALIIASKNELLDQLANEMPNFTGVIREIQSHMTVLIESGAPIHFPPILLLGGPGIGKTHFANRLAEIFGVSNHFISMGTVSSNFVLAGNSPQWKGADMGQVTKGMLLGKEGNPIFVLDEIDKTSGSKEYNPMTPFYTLFEGHTAKRFRDEFLDLEIDTSYVTWILTANSIDPIPEPIRSRMLVFKVRNPTFDEFKIIVRSLVRKTLKDNPKFQFSDEVSDSVVQRIAKISPREIGSMLIGAMGRARQNDRRHLEPEDFNLNLVDSRGPGIGFVRD